MRSTLVILGVAAILLILTYAILTLVGWPWDQNFLLVGIFLILLTILSHQINLRSINKEGRAVIVPYILSTVLKLILGGAFLMIMVKLNPEIVKGLVIVFLLYYATFSALEIILVSRRTQQKKF